ncbi:MAG: class I SAM-dependent methyltransferase [Candidatus Aquicultorales bacterium]
MGESARKPMTAGTSIYSPKTSLSRTSYIDPSTFEKLIAGYLSCRRSIAEIDAEDFENAGRIARKAPGASVTCVLFEPAGAASPEGVEEVVVPGWKLPFEDAFFDLVYNVNRLHLYDDPALPLAEMERVLKPGGFMVMASVRRDQNPLAGRIVGRSQDERSRDIVAASYTRREMELVLGTSGFSKWSLKRHPYLLVIAAEKPVQDETIRLQVRTTLPG